MSNNIYNILNSFNKVAQEPAKPAPKAAKPKSQLQEGMEQVLQRKLIAEKKAKPDYVDLDKDGNKKETMKKAAKDAKKVEEGSTGDYSATKARAGKDIGKPGKNFAKIAKGAAERYGSKEAGERVAGAVRAKLAKAGKLEESSSKQSIRNAIARAQAILEEGKKKSSGKKPAWLEKAEVEVVQ